MHPTSIRRAIRASLAAALCFLSATSPAAPRQESANSLPGQPLKATSVAVEVYAIVEGRHGRLIHDLNANDFDLTDDGAPQKIAYFSRETNVALSLGLAIDTSLSQDKLLKTEQSAAKEFLRSVLRPGDRAFVMNFDVDVQLRQDFTGEPGDLARAVDSAEVNRTGTSLLQENAPAKPTGGTRLYDAVYLASNELMKARVGRKVLVLVTDGEDQGSKSNLQQSIESAERSNVIVYSIVVSDPQFYALMGSSYHGDAGIRKLARATGGRTIRLQSISQIGQGFDRIARELRSQYLIGYAPLNPRYNGSFHRIQLRVRGHNYTIQARSGYYDREDALKMKELGDAAGVAP
jgi:VWFA-related protein